LCRNIKRAFERCFVPIHDEASEPFRTMVFHRPVCNPQLSYSASDIGFNYDAPVLGSRRPTNSGELFVDSLDILRAVMIWH